MTPEKKVQLTEIVQSFMPDLIDVGARVFNACRLTAAGVDVSRETQEIGYLVTEMLVKIGESRDFN